MKQNDFFNQKLLKCFCGLMAILLALVLGACSGMGRTTEDAGKTEAPGETEALSVKEVRLSELQSDSGFCVAGYNDSARGIIYSLYCDISEDHHAEKDHYYLLRYETNLLTEAFWNDEPVAARLCHKGEINGADWNILWTRFYTIYESEKTSAEEPWKQSESIGVCGTGCERPIVFKLTECSDDYRTVSGYKDKGLLSLLKAEYEILGTKKQLIDGLTPDKK
jgi:hypothetical protein